MNTPNDLLPQAALACAWTLSPWGMVTIGLDGKVAATNPGFEACTGTPGAAVLGMSEADFNHALIGMQEHEHRRVETAGGDLLAVYYCSCERCSSWHSPHNQGPVRTAEILREPLTGIYGYVELLLTQNYDEVTRHNLLATVLEQIEVLSNLINTQLDNSKREGSARNQIPALGFGLK